MSSAVHVKELGEATSVQQLPLSDSLSRTSPPLPAPRSDPQISSKSRERRNPSITPRKFGRFFAPRAQPKLPISSSRRALHELSTSRLNRSSTPSSTLPPFPSIGEQENLSPRLSKRRKVGHSAEDIDHLAQDEEPKSMSLLEEMAAEQSWDSPQTSPCARPARTARECDTEEVESAESMPASRLPIKRITRMRNRGLGAQLLGLSIGGGSRIGRQHHEYPVNDYQDHTADFSTHSEDVHMVSSLNNPSRRCIPFCLAPCNTNSLVALGDEEGRIRLIETNKEEKPEFSQHYLATRVHMNAVMDLTFSRDDLLLATAGGDQTCRVVDMPTQTTVAILAGHSASLKQVRFQPGVNNGKILATSARDGTVQLWDLRCKGDQGPQHKMMLPVENNVRVDKASNHILYGRPVNSMYDAHRTWNFGLAPNGALLNQNGPLETRSGPVSITAMEFLPAGREHFLLTACEADAAVRLWDVRFLYNKSKASPTPISITKTPETHNAFRHYGVNSINVSSDGSRFYTLCKDHTVYAYSTAHLIMGTAPELTRTTQSRPGPQRNIQQGLGPLYGFRHANLHVTSFYTKSAIRPARGGKAEMLAVGSNDHSPVLFPLDERYLPAPPQRESTSTLSGHTNNGGFGPLLCDSPLFGGRSAGNLAANGRMSDTIPISTKGTALIRGHTAEVNGIAWSNNGDLISIGDDYLVRCWREGSTAKDLRQCGEGGGRRWLSGWADVTADFDGDDFAEVSVPEKSGNVHSGIDHHGNACYGSDDEDVESASESEGELP